MLFSIVAFHACGQNKSKKENQMNENDAMNLLASGQSFSSYERQRKQVYFETPDACRKRSDEKIEKESTGRKSCKDHVGPLDSYTFDRDQLKLHLEQSEEGNRNWREIASTFEIKNENGQLVRNGGQVVQKFAISLGVDVEINARLRRAKRKLPDFNVAFTPTRSARDISVSVQEKVLSGELDIGKSVAPKTFTCKVLQLTDGTLVEKSTEVEGRMYSIDQIRKQDTERLSKIGMLRSSAQEHDRYFTIWADHSDLLSHSHFLITFSWIYDPSWALTDEEYKAIHGHNADVQSIVERPVLHLLARSGSTVEEQLVYGEKRLNDMVTTEQITINGITYSDRCRFFCGDGPQRAVEWGQQQGGFFPCPCGAEAKRFKDLHYCLR